MSVSLRAFEDDILRVCGRLSSLFLDALPGSDDLIARSAAERLAGLEASDGAELIGGLVYRNLAPAGVAAAEVTLLAVAAKWRRRGVGSKLLRVFQSRLLGGALAVQALSTSVFFYRALGFRNPTREEEALLVDALWPPPPETRLLICQATDGVTTLKL